MQIIISNKDETKAHISKDMRNKKIKIAALVIYGKTGRVPSRLYR